MQENDRGSDPDSPFFRHINGWARPASSSKPFRDARAKETLLRQGAGLRSGAGTSGMEIWGTGSPMREFLHADDCADGLVFLMKHYSEAEHMNLGSGTDIRIDELAAMMMDVVGRKGDLRKDASKPDGAPKKLMDNARIAALGWTSKISLREGVKGVYADAPFRASAQRPATRLCRPSAE